MFYTRRLGHIGTERTLRITRYAGPPHQARSPMSPYSTDAPFIEPGLDVEMESQAVVIGILEGIGDGS